MPMDKVRAVAAGCEDAARSCDATLDPNIPPFAPLIPLAGQAAARVKLADALGKLLQDVEPAILVRWATEPVDALVAGRRRLANRMLLSPRCAGPLDGEILANLGNRLLDSLPIATHLVLLSTYQDFARKWYSFLPLKAKSDAAQVVAGHGLGLSVPNATRVQTFLTGLRARLRLSAIIAGLGGEKSPTTIALLSDQTIEKSLKGHAATIEFLLNARADTALGGLTDRVSAALARPAEAAALIDGLRKSPARATALEKLEASLDRSRLFAADWLGESSNSFRAGSASLAVLMPLRSRIDSLEGVLRVRQGLATLPDDLRRAVEGLLGASVEADRAGRLLRREALAGEISARLAAEPILQGIDGHRLQTSFTRYRELDEKKHDLTRDVIQNHWISRQKERLLAASGLRLNSVARTFAAG